MKAFDRVRPRDINIEKPVSDVDKVLTYYAFNEPALNGFSKELSENRNRKEQYSIQFTKEIETSTLKDILGDALPASQEMDFLSIDVGGLDFEVLRSNDFNKYRLKVILIEILGGTICDIEDNPVTEFLARYNYLVLSKTINTVIYIDSNYYEKRFSGAM